MRRITVDEVKAACEQTGYTLAPRRTIDHSDHCGCPLGIVALADGLVMSASWSVPVPARLMRILELDPEYGWGLVAGFDDGDGVADPGRNPARAMGVEDGRAIREALVPEGVRS